MLRALAGEAMDALQLLLDLERASLAARRAVTRLRRHSRGDSPDGAAQRMAPARTWSVLAPR